MNRIYKWMCMAVVAVLLLVAVLAIFTGDGEIRPVWDISHVLEGSWFRDYQTYFAETFPGRKLMGNVVAKLEAFYNFGEEVQPELQSE